MYHVMRPPSRWGFNYVTRYNSFGRYCQTPSFLRGLFAHGPWSIPLNKTSLTNLVDHGHCYSPTEKHSPRQGPRFRVLSAEFYVGISCGLIVAAVCRVFATVTTRILRVVAIADLRARRPRCRPQWENVDCATVSTP